MALLPWKDMHRFTLPPRFLGPLSRAPRLPSLLEAYLPSSSVGGNPFASLCIIGRSKFCDGGDVVWKDLAAQVEGWSCPWRKPFANELLVVYSSHARRRFCSRIRPIVTEPKFWRSLTNHGMEEHGGDGDGWRRGARVQFSPPPRAHSARCSVSYQHSSGRGC